MPVMLPPSAKAPLAVLTEPVVLRMSARYPLAVLPPLAVLKGPLVLLMRAFVPIAVVSVPIMTLGSAIFGVLVPVTTKGDDAVTAVTPASSTSHTTEPSALMALIDDPAGQAPVTRTW